jgi:hypothetical protein
MSPDISSGPAAAIRAIAVIEEDFERRTSSKREPMGCSDG